MTEFMLSPSEDATTPKRDSLIIVCGNDEFQLNRSGSFSFLYKIGAATAKGGEFLEINDSYTLNSIAEQNRDSYVEWVNSLSSIYSDYHLVKDGVSLFFLSDASCKRAELFDTFQTICNCLFLKHRLRTEVIKEISIYGANIAFAVAVESIFPTAAVRSISAKGFSGRFRNQISNGLYFLRLTGIAMTNIVGSWRPSRREQDQGDTLFFSIYPKMFSDSGLDKKYGTQVGKSDSFLITIVSDGFHQKVGLLKFLRLRRQAKSAKKILIDDQIKLVDCLVGLYWWGRLSTFNLSIRKKNFSYKKIDISQYVHTEICRSGDRISRLLALGRALNRVLSKLQPQSLIYYLHEYSLGRMISQVAQSNHPVLKTYGFQHGPASWRKLVYFLGSLASTDQQKIEQVPIPDHVFAEDVESKSIYEYSGYRNVSLMGHVSRTDYLERFENRMKEDHFLLVPGLHDGLALLRFLETWLMTQPKKKFLFKPHPLANLDYVGLVHRIPNVELTEQSVTELLSNVEAVFVTYSSLGVEALQVGRSVVVVNIPGTINESPLIDRRTKMPRGVFDFERYILNVH
jgi:hypothetical protein